MGMGGGFDTAHPVGARVGLGGLVVVQSNPASALKASLISETWLAILQTSHAFG
jgi:hypothetical protein